MQMAQGEETKETCLDIIEYNEFKEKPNPLGK